MKKKILHKIIICVSILGTFFSMAQVGINTNNPNPSSMLDITANPVTNNKGILLPKVYLISNTDNTTIPFPATGLIIINSNSLIGNGIYVNKGTPASPSWQRMKLLQSNESSRFISTMVYSGLTSNASQILNTDTFQWRFVPTGANYALQMRLKAAPITDIITTPTFALFWNISGRGSIARPSFTWNSTNWETWQTFAIYASGHEGLFYFGVQGTTKLFRVSMYTVRDSYNSLMVEQF